MGKSCQSVRPLCSTVCKYSTCFLIFPSPLHGVNIDPAYGKKGRGERRDIRGMLPASPEKREGQRRLFPPHIQCTRNVLYRPRFKGREDPFFFSKNTTDFSERKGRRGEEELQWRGRTTRIEFPIFPLSRSPLQNFFSSPSPPSPFTSPSYFCALLPPPSPALKRDEAKEEEEAPDAQHTLSPPRLFFAVVESFSIFGRRVYKIRHGFREGGSMYASSMCMCTYM